METKTAKDLVVGDAVLYSGASTKFQWTETKVTSASPAYVTLSNYGKIARATIDKNHSYKIPQ